MRNTGDGYEELTETVSMSSAHSMNDLKDLGEAKRRRNRLILAFGVAIISVVVLAIIIPLAVHGGQLLFFLH
jgi:hypothetical protein